MGFAIGGSFYAAFLAPTSTIDQSCTTGQQPGTNCQAPKKGQNSTEDALGNYTKWLMIFTGVLAFATISLSIATIGLYISGESQLSLAREDSQRQAIEIQDQIDIARISARAADDSAKAAVAAERARFYIVIKKHNLNDILKAIGRYPNSPTMPLAPHSPSIEYAFKNYGKTPGIISEVSHGLEVHPGPPDPVYIVSDHLFIENMIAAGDETEPQKFDAPILFHTVADGLPIITDQKHFWFYGRFDYEDVFGNPQVHRWLMRYVRMGTGWGFQPYDHKHYSKSS